MANRISYLTEANIYCVHLSSLATKSSLTKWLTTEQVKDYLFF